MSHPNFNHTISTSSKKNERAREEVQSSSPNPKQTLKKLRKLYDQHTIRSLYYKDNSLSKTVYAGIYVLLKGRYLMPLSKEKQKEYNRLYYLKRKKLSIIKKSISKTQPASLKIAPASRFNSSFQTSKLKPEPQASGLSYPDLRPRGFIQTVTPWLGCFVYTVLTVALISFLVITEVSFYTLKGYGVYTALFFAAIFHLCKVSLGFSISRSNWELNLLLIPALFLLVLGLGWVAKQSAEKHAQIVEGLSGSDKKELLILEEHYANAKEDTKRAKLNIESARTGSDKIWLTSLYRKNTKPNLLESRRKLQDFIKTHKNKTSVTVSETNAIVYLRWLGIFLSIVFSILAGASMPMPKAREVAYV